MDCRPGGRAGLAAAFAATPRAGFLPRPARRRASYDGPIQIGRGQTNSQPRTVAACCACSRSGPGDRVLDVGSGSGWTTALLAHLTGPAGEVRRRRAGARRWSTFGRANLARARPALGADRAGRPGAARLARRRRRSTGSSSPPRPRSLPSRAGRPAGRRRPDGDPGQPARCCWSRARPTGPRSASTGGYRFVPLR